MEVSVLRYNLRKFETNYCISICYKISGKVKKKILNIFCIFLKEIKIFFFILETLKEDALS